MHMSIEESCANDGEYTEYYKQYANHHLGEL